MSAFALPIPPADLTVRLHWLMERSATASYDARNFGAWLEPRYIFGARTLI